MKNIILIGALVVILVGGAYFLMQDGSDTYTNTPTTDVVPTENTDTTENPVVETETKVEPEVDEPMQTVGTSVNGNDITAYHFGSGDTELLFLSGIHGGYSWNTSMLGFELVDWFTANEASIPSNIKVTVIPVLNPDGLEKVTGSAGRFAATNVSAVDSVKVAGRFNANEVDLNRNFDCEWTSSGTWQSKSVSGGTAAFSEPESQAVRNYVLASKPAVVVTWYSAAGGVYSSSCSNGPSTETRALTNLFAKASGYTAYEEFDYYEITGDMVNWFAKQNIPAISVLLTNREQTEFSKNIAGVQAVLKQYAE